MVSLDRVNICSTLSHILQTGKKIPNYPVTLYRPSGLSRYFIPVMCCLCSIARSFSPLSPSQMHMIQKCQTWQEQADDITEEGFLDKIIICFWTLGFAPSLGREAAAPDKCPFVRRFFSDTCKDILFPCLFVSLVAPCS